MIASALHRPVICLVTCRSRMLSDDGGVLVRLARSAAEAGVNLIQVREPHLEARQLAGLTRRIVEATSSTGARVVVNDRMDVAIAAGAHGVHLRADSVGAARARGCAPAGFLVGQSVHSAAEAMVAEASGADYLILGTIFPTPSKPDAPIAGTSVLAHACRSVRVPVLAIGGVTRDRLGEVARAGAAGIAAIGLFTGAVEAAEDGGVETYMATVVRAVRRAFAES